MLLTLMVGTLSAQDMLTEHHQMTTLDLSVGLPHNNVNQFYVDSQGFVWISTYGGGAVRYDGFSFMSVALTNPQGFSSNSCKRITEDRFHRLWIAYDERTDVIDMRTMSRTLPVCKQGDLNAILNRLSVAVYHDAKGAVWQVNSDTIYRYSFDENGAVNHISNYHYVGNTPDVCIKDIEQNGSVWVCIDGGLYRLVERNGKLTREDIAPVMSQLRGFYVTDMLKRGTKVWISTNLGLYVYDTYSHQLQSYRHTEDPRSLSHDFTTALAEAPDGRLLVGSLRGVNILSEQMNAFDHWDSKTANQPLPSDFVHCLMVRDGQVWVGTETAGIAKLTPRPLLLRNYSHQPNQPASISPNPVNAMYVESDGGLWVGTVEGGLNYKAAGSQLFEHWTAQNSALSHNSVSVLETDAHGHLWIGTWGGGLNLMSFADHQVKHFDMPADMVAQTNYIGSLAYDKYNDALWIGSNDGVFYLDLKTGRLEEPFDDNRLVRGCIGTLIDNKGRLWIGCMTGVRIIDLRSRKTGGGRFRVKSIFAKLDKQSSNIVDKLCCFYQTRDGTLWLGSNGYGLYQCVVDEKTGEESFLNLTTADGLSNNAVHGIVEDKTGKLWITTANGLSVYDPLARTFINYDESDGLLSQHFYWNSVAKAPNGTLYFGSVDGLIEVVDENKDAKSTVHLAFTQLFVDNQIVTPVNSDVISEDISQASVIQLHESFRSFAIEFSSLTYGGTTGHYSYRLKGFEDEWTSLPPEVHSARYTTLKPGTYTLEVRYSTDLDEEEVHQIAVRIVVTPYFWKSWWFDLLILIVLIAFVVWFYRYKEREWKRQEADKLLTPIRKVLEEADEPQQLQSRIQNILDNHEKLKVSYHKSVEADKEEVMRTNKPFMVRATEIMEQHYADSEFGVTEFAEAIGMSKPLLSKRLNAEAGMSTGQFIRNYRLTIAKRLLLENYANRNITEIAYKVGFNDPKYFTRCFTHQFGCSPSTYTGDDK